MVCIKYIFGFDVKLFSGSVFAADPLAVWQPKFDQSGAEYTDLLPTVSHSEIEGATVGYRIRDHVWKESHGRLYVDNRPISLLGGEKDVLRKLKLGGLFRGRSVRWFWHRMFPPTWDS